MLCVCVTATEQGEHRQEKAPSSISHVDSCPKEVHSVMMRGRAEDKRSIWFRPLQQGRRMRDLL